LPTQNLVSTLPYPEKNFSISLTVASKGMFLTNNLWCSVRNSGSEGPSSSSTSSFSKLLWFALKEQGGGSMKVQQRGEKEKKKEKEKREGSFEPKPLVLNGKDHASVATSPRKSQEAHDLVHSLAVFHSALQHHRTIRIRQVSIQSNWQENLKGGRAKKKKKF